MRRVTPLLPVLAAAVLLVAGCGSESAGSQTAASGGRGTADGQTPVSDPGKNGVRITAMSVPSPARAASELSATYEVTNDGTQALTYTIVFSFLSADGGAVSNQRETVRNVGPGRTVTRSLTMGELPAAAPAVTRVKVLEVTSVPADEAPAAPGACPSSGIRVTADQGDAAMGLRVVGLWVENCGTGAYKIEGYPELTLLDEAHRQVDGVKILHGSGGISSSDDMDRPPQPLTLKPGERARSVIQWRNTTQFGTPVNAPYVRVVAKPGATPVTVTPHLDLGTTGKLGVGPWQTVDEQPPQQVE
ncbi:DUF4232 domain-containing protein [Streptomyces griseus]|uniref:DUF4232 domain-containing protein n=1 Tax=Streptomyces griseus TaxID=1911 RepID=UPI00056C5D1F|nr:DUF4232 domain-containing protein [Streptomyces griseus]